MIKKPSRLLEKFAAKLFGEDCSRRDAFVSSIVQGRKYSQALFWTKEKPPVLPFECETAYAWQPSFVDVVARDVKPGSLPLHENGHYYCLDISSVFELSALSAIDSKLRFIIDVCSAPGGKGIFAWRKFNPELIIFNEVIGKRHGALRSNVKRCGVTNCEVTCLDSSVIGEQYNAQADLVLVDAPCSGQSLLARGKDAYGCFHPQIIKMNKRRQSRILSNAAKAVKSGGYIMYSTCTFSKDENEDVVEWFCKGNPEFEGVKVAAIADYQSEYSRISCYRLWPDMSIGAGGFCCLLKKN